MYASLRAACMRQGVPSYVCEHAQGYLETVKMAHFSNVKVCEAPAGEEVATSVHLKGLLQTASSASVWPDKTKYPELYR